MHIFKLGTVWFSFLFVSNYIQVIFENKNVNQNIRLHYKYYTNSLSENRTETMIGSESGVRKGSGRPQSRTRHITQYPDLLKT